MKYLLIIGLMFMNVAASAELDMLYNKNYDSPRSVQEETLIAHVKVSWEKAMRKESSLCGTTFIEDKVCKNWPIAVCYHHLLNNLCALEGASHLHVGLLKGGSFIAALYGNQHLLTDQIGIDWFKEYPEDKLIANCDMYLDSGTYRMFNYGCFEVDKSIFRFPVDIYFYDADHSLMAHEKAFTYYNDVFADVFVAVVDDWGCPWVRKPTFKAFDKLGYRILYEEVIPSSETHGHGQYVAVIRKSDPEPSSF